MTNVSKIVIGCIAVGLLAVLGTWYLWQGDRQTVLSTESPERQEQLEALLVGNGIRFEWDEQQRVTVANEDLLLARTLADQASLTLPQRSGFELFENEDYGATEFVQRINYQRALQAELERTVIRIAGIRNARVHILQPNRSTFFKRDSVSRASVVLELERDVHLSAVAPSVGELLVGAIDGLKIDDVKIISGHGDVVAASRGDRARGIPPMQTTADEMEQRLAETIYRVLNPLYDRSSIGVSVSVELDRATRTLRRQNSPNSYGDGDAMSSERDQGSIGPGSQLVTEDVSMPPGEIERIGVGVMLPHPTSNEEIVQIENLLRAGLGLSDLRGDTLSVMAYRNFDVPAVKTRTEDVLPVAKAPAPVRSSLLDLAPISVLQFNLALLVAAACFLVLLFIKIAFRQRQKRKLVGLLSDWVQGAAGE